MKKRKTDASISRSFELERALMCAKRAGTPSYRFGVGEEVAHGAWRKAQIAEVYDDGLAYLVVDSDTDGHTPVVSTITAWVNVRPKIDNAQRTTAFCKNEDIRLSYSDITIESLLYRHLHFGVNFDPEYQRGYVWTQRDKDLLLESIFMGADIGRFVVRHYNDKESAENPELTYEIVDGKQRFLTLLSFFENRWSYKGAFFNDLSNKDRRKFLDAMTSFAEVRGASKADTLRLFLLLNRGGQTVTEDVLQHAQALLEQATKSE